MLIDCRNARNFVIWEKWRSGLRRGARHTTATSLSSLLFLSYALLLAGCSSGGSSSGSNPPPSGPASGSEFLYCLGGTGVNNAALNPSTGSLSTLQSAMGFIPFLDFGSFNIDPAQTTIFASSGSKYIYAGGDGEAPYYSGIFAFTIPGTAGQLSSISGAGFFDPQIPFGGVTGMTMDGLGRFIYLSDYGAYINYVREFTMSPSGQMQEGPIITDKSAMQWTIQAADPTGKFVYAWYYSANGNIALTVFTVDASTGVLTEVAGSPFLVAAGSSTVPSGTFQFLGGSIVFSPTGKFLYASVANYPVTQNSTFTNDYIYTFSIDPLTGSLSPVAGSPVSLPNTAVVPLAMHPDGKFLYASPRPSNSAPAPGILMFPIDATTGAIMDTPVSVGGGNQYYRQMLIDPSGNVLLAITPGISSFTINSTTGLLTSAGTATTASGTAASCGSSVIAKIP